MNTFNMINGHNHSIQYLSNGEVLIHIRQGWTLAAILSGTPGISGIDVDPFQAHLPFFMQAPQYFGQRMIGTREYRRGSAIIDAFIRSEYMQNREFGSCSDMFIDDPERAERCYEAAEFGCDGSTHQERIQDWRDAFSSWLCEHSHSDNPKDRFESCVALYLDELESWHEMNGTLFEQIG